MYVLIIFDMFCFDDAFILQQIPNTSRTRFNERKLAEMNAWEQDNQFRSRTSRLDKWKEVARLEAQAHKVKLDLPDKIEMLCVNTGLCIFFCLRWFLIFQ